VAGVGLLRAFRSARRKIWRFRRRVQHCNNAGGMDTEGPVLNHTIG
jgi:hypothetical protein